MADITTHWWQLPRPCARCGRHTECTDIIWGRTGEIRIFGYCDECKTHTQFDTCHDKVLEFCMAKDWAKHYTERIEKMKEAKQLPEPLLNPDDVKLLGEMHIKENDEP